MAFCVGMGLINPSIVALSLCGFLVSLYGVHVERSGRLDASYQAHCDIDRTVSCSDVLLSEYVSTSCRE